jgi:hypothetical protein
MVQVDYYYLVLDSITVQNLVDFQKIVKFVIDFEVYELVD